MRLLVGLNTLIICMGLSNCCVGQDVSSTVAAVVPNGSALALGETCYTLTSNKNGATQPIGFVFQSIDRQSENGVDALKIVVHQHLSDGRFDLRDSFLLRRSDLRPIRLDTDRDGMPHVHLDYAGNKVIGWKMVKGSKERIDVSFDGPVWDGNLWGVTFAALPLTTLGEYHLPIYQYDNGKGSFLVSVEGDTKVSTPAGTADAWKIKAGVKADERVDYFVGKSPLMELGFAAGPMSQHVGGDCAGLK